MREIKASSHKVNPAGNKISTESARATMKITNTPARNPTAIAIDAQTLGITKAFHNSFQLLNTTYL
jgi:hypothetical protein